VLTALLGAAIAVVDLLWLQRFRSGGPLTVDESGYIGIATSNADALRQHGPWALVQDVVNQHYEAPLVPLLAGLLEVGIASRAPLAAFGVLPLASFVVVLATYAVARRLVPPAWSCVAAVMVGCIPELVTYSRFFEFAVPATAAMMLAVWALLESDALGNRGWAIAFGVAAGLLPLTRTMTVAFLPGLALAAVLQIAVHRRRGSIVNLALASVAAILTAATWYGANARYVAYYLLHFGYGSDANSFGASHSLFSWGFWSKEAGVMISGLNAPLAAVGAVGIAAAACVLLSRGASRRGELLRAILRSDSFVLLLVLAEGYLVLSSSRNVGTGFDLPLLPLAITLSVVGAARLGREWRSRGRHLAVIFAIAAIAASLVALVSTSDLVDGLSTTNVSVPGFGSQPLITAGGKLRSELSAAGYRIPEPNEQLPASLRTWGVRIDSLTRSIVADAPLDSVGAPLVAAPPDLLYSANSFVLSARRQFGQRLIAADLRLPAGQESTLGYRKLVERISPDVVVIPRRTAYEAWTPGLDQLVRALRLTGYAVRQRVIEPNAIVEIYSR
jgi:4-amino-4-deoxy-L-arabinose transferase-like glycosyltransferase